MDRSLIQLIVSYLGKTAICPLHLLCAQGKSRSVKHLVIAKLLTLFCKHYHMIGIVLKRQKYY